MIGYFKLQRRFFSHALWEEEREFSRAEAFLDLLQLAAYAHTKKIVKGVLIELEPGQLCGSERYLSGRWNWSTKKVRNFLTLLEADRMVDVEKKREGSVITLRNYKKYASSDPLEEAPKKHQGSTEEAPRKQIEEGKEGKKREERAPAPASEWSEHHPSGTASEFDRVTKLINDCNPQWRKAMTRIEMDTLQANARFIFVLTDADWCLVRAYMHAMIPEHLGKFYQPNSRQRFIQEISDVLGHADRWKSACRRAGIPTGLEPQKTA